MSGILWTPDSNNPTPAPGSLNYDPQTYAFNFKSQKWSTIALRLLYAHHQGVASYNNKAYFIGGCVHNKDSKGNKERLGLNQVQIYDPITNSWSYGIELPEIKCSPSVAVIKDSMYVCGGLGNDGTTKNTCYRFDFLGTQQWVPIATMPIGRNHAAGGTDGEKFYIFGGRGCSVDGSCGIGYKMGTDNGFGETQVYDPSSNSWSSSITSPETLAPLPEGRGGAGAAAYVNGNFYVLGGETLKSADVINIVFVFVYLFFCKNPPLTYFFIVFIRN